MIVADCAFTPQNPDFEAVVRASFANQGAMAHLGAELGSVEPGYAEIGLPFRAEVSQQHDYFHGGIIATIGDNAGGYAAFSLMPAGSTILTVEFKISLLAPAKGDRLLACGQVKRAGRTLTVCDVDVYCIAGTSRSLCATMLETLMCLPPGRDRPAG